MELCTSLTASSLFQTISAVQNYFELWILSLSKGLETLPIPVLLTGLRSVISVPLVTNGTIEQNWTQNRCDACGTLLEMARQLDKEALIATEYRFSKPLVYLSCAYTFYFLSSCVSVKSLPVRMQTLLLFLPPVRLPCQRGALDQA